MDIYGIALSASKAASQPSNVQKPSKTDIPQPNIADDAAITTLSSGAFDQKLEKHINDHVSGKGHMSRDMYSQLFKKQAATSNLMLETNFDAQQYLTAFQTLGLSYDKEARMVDQLGDSTVQTAKIIKATEDN